MSGGGQCTDLVTEQGRRENNNANVTDTHEVDHRGGADRKD